MCGSRVPSRLRFGPWITSTRMARLELLGQARRGEAHQEARLAEVPLGRERDREEVAWVQHPHDEQEALGLDRHLLAEADLQAVGGLADLREDEAELHPDRVDVEALRLAHVRLD